MIKYLNIAVLVLLLGVISCEKDKELDNISEFTIIKDTVFEKLLISSGLDTILDGTVRTSNIDKVTQISYVDDNISDLSGIEGFKSLTHLLCVDNQLKSLDLSKNINLVFLKVSGNQLNHLNVSKNTKLTTLDCGNNQLTSLDVSKNINLVDLRCYMNQLKILDISNNTKLTRLECQINQLNILDISKNKALELLTCSNNQLTSLDISKNLILTDISCGNNQLANLDVTKNSFLTVLSCHHNLLAKLNLKNGNNISIRFFDARYNNLSCIEVDNPFWSAENWQNVDDNSSFSTNCNN